MSSNLVLLARTLANRLVAASPRSGELNWLPQGMGKRSVRWHHEGRSLVLQVRPSVSFYEPVVEACSKWTTAGLDTLPLLARGTLCDGGRFYVFPFVPWPTATAVLGAAPKGIRTMQAIRVGAAFGRLNTVSTRGFGCFEHGLNAKDKTWFDFVQARTIKAATGLVAKGVVSLSRMARIHRVLCDLEPLIADVASRLVYVDVKLENVLLRPESGDLLIVDYDYLLSGDPKWVLGRLAPLYDDDEVRESLMAGFCSISGQPDPRVLRAYELAHSLELLTTPTRNSKLVERRRRLLARLERLL